MKGNTDVCLSLAFRKLPEEIKLESFFMIVSQIAARQI